MKKLITYHLIIAAALGMSACEGIWTEFNLPDAVKSRFAEMYPAAAQVEWDKEREHYEADFEMGERERSAVFSEAGDLISYSEKIEERHLPGPALEVLQQYTGFQLDEAQRVHQDREMHYEVELERGDEETLLLFNEAGQLIRQQTAADPQAPVKVEASLASLPGATPGGADPLPAPEATWKLPAALREVSGIAWLQDDVLASVQDEDGIIYLYDLKQEAVTAEIKFAGPGDYEGIALVGSTAFVLRSDGALYEVRNFQGGKPEVTLHESDLPSTLDTEGMAYDEKNNRLLLSGKGFDERLGNNKGIYAFTLADKKMNPNPVITIPLAQDKIGKSGKKKKSDYDVLQPSSLEISPATGEMYLLDAENHRLLTINPQGQVLKTSALDKDKLRQPEGLTFGAQGGLYISSEGSKGGNGVIVKFPAGI